MRHSTALTAAIVLLFVSALIVPSPGHTASAASGITLRSSSTGTNGAGATTLSLPLPAGTQSGDLLVAQIAINSTSTVITPPAGWSGIMITNSTSSVKLATYYKAASGSEPADYTWTFSASQPATGGITSLAGAETASPIDASAGRYNGSTAAVRFTQIATTVADDMLLAFVAVSGNTTVTPPAGFTESYDLNDPAASKGKTAEMSYALKATAGLTAVPNGAEDSLTVSNLTQLVAIRPAGTAPTSTPTNAGTSTPTSTPTDTPTATPTQMAAPFPVSIQNVFVIVMENTNWSGIQGNTVSAPYINSLLARPDASYATQYYNPAGIHPSEPNYIWMEAGDSNNLPGTNAFNLDGDPSAANETTTTDHLTTYLQNSGISWTAYMEGIPGGTCPITGGNLYVPRHNPFVYFTDVAGDPPSAASANCIAHMAPFTQLATDLQNGTVARYAFIVPNLCNDMHDACAPSTDRILQGDMWLQANLPAILDSAAYQQGGAVFITWDEGQAGDGPIGMIVLSPYAKGNGYQNSIPYDHSSLLRTLQEIFGVSPILRNAGGAADLSDLFLPSMPPTATPTDTPTVTPTATATASPTDTPTVTATATVTASPTDTPTGTLTSTPTSAPTATPTDTATASPTSPATATPTYTPSATSTFTPTAPATATPTNTPTLTPTYTPTATATNTPTQTPTTTPTNTPTNTPTFTATNTPTATPSAASTGYRNAAANAAQKGGDGNGYEVSPGNAYADDGAFAVDNNSGTSTSSSCTNSGKDKHVFYDYSFVIPGGAAVQGIEVQLKAKADSSANSPRICVQLSWNGGSKWTSAKATSTLTTTETTYVLGSAADLWGHAWTPSELQNTTFRVRLIDVATSTARDFSLDWVSVRVTYH